jgi:hypothetical protein
VASLFSGRHPLDKAGRAATAVSAGRPSPASRLVFAGRRSRLVLIVFFKLDRLAARRSLGP